MKGFNARPAFFGLGVSAALACARCTTPGASPSAPAVAAASVPGSSSAASAPVANAASPTPAPPSTLEDLVGKPAPDFTATAQDGTTMHLAALKGKPVVVYFYPKDETPGCTKEACAFRDNWKAILATGAVLVGVSADTLDSHRSFAAAHQLPFLLVSDPDGAIAQKYGVPFHGVHQRQTIVVGVDGSIKKVYRHVDVGSHAEEILADLKS
jgi:thioredoxin-dependent peroxiredoxin